MGRPKKPITKQSRFTVHCTAAEALSIKAKARMSGLTVSVYLLNSGLELPIHPKLSSEEIQIFRVLVGMGNNLNQIAKRLNTTGTLSPSDHQELMKIKTLINRLT